MMIDIHQVKNTLHASCIKAGDYQMQHFNQSIEAVDKESISSVVTFVDLGCEKIIIETIKAHFPKHNILSEECGFENQHSPYTWVIDPLDGTSNYAANLPWFGVLIALFEDDQVIASAAYLPVTSQFFYAEKGKGAYLNDQLLSIQSKALSSSLFAFSTDYCKNEAYLDKGIEMYRYLIQHSRNVRTTNSLFDLVNVATNKFGGCINLFNKIWDIAAPSLLILEAGGVISSLENEPIHFLLSTNDIKKNYSVLCGNVEVYTQLKQELPF